MIYLSILLLLPLAWLVVLLARWLLGGAFRSQDTAAKDDAGAFARWQSRQTSTERLHQEAARHAKEQDEMEKHAANNEQVYATRDSQREQFNKAHHVGEEKETVFPETRRASIKPGTKPDNKH